MPPLTGCKLKVYTPGATVDGLPPWHIAAAPDVTHPPVATVDGHPLWHHVAVLEGGSSKGGKAKITRRDEVPVSNVKQ